jgi:hypothetical protein
MDIAVFALALFFTLLFMGRLIGSVRAQSQDLPDIVGVILFMLTYGLWIAFYIIIR